MLPSNIYALGMESDSTQTRMGSVYAGITPANTATADSLRADSAKVRMRQYVGAASTLTTNHRSLGLPAEYAAQYGNMPLSSVGINFIAIGNFLFQTNRLRSSVTFERFVNVYPSNKILENFRECLQIGYYVYERDAIKLYPFIGGTVGLYYIDNGIRLGVFAAEAGAGLDYFIPKTSLLAGLQVSYNHTWNIRSAADAVGNIGGVAVRAHVSILFSERTTWWGW